MDNRIKELILGYDLCNDYIQISCYNQKTQDMDTICYIGEKMMDRFLRFFAVSIPTVPGSAAMKPGRRSMNIGACW